VGRFPAGGLSVGQRCTAVVVSSEGPDLVAVAEHAGRPARGLAAPALDRPGKPAVATDRHDGRPVPMGLGGRGDPPVAGAGRGPDGAASGSRRRRRWLDTGGIGAGLATPVEILTDDPARVRAAVAGLPAVAASITWPAQPGGQTRR
jgi:hypothetical protein